MVEHIGKKAFHVSGLKFSVSPKSFREVGARAFSYYEQLRSVVLPEGVTKAMSDWFVESIIESMTVSESVWELGTMAFFGCERLCQ